MPHTALPRSAAPTPKALPTIEPSTSALSRIAWVSGECPPLPPVVQQGPSRPVYAPYKPGLPARIYLRTLDRFTLEPLPACAARQHSAGRPYVYMHIAARPGMQNTPVDALAAEPWLALHSVADARDPRLSPPTLSYTLENRSASALIDNIFFFCLLGADCRLQWLGSLADTATNRVAQLVITTMLGAERGDAQALLRAGLLFTYGLAVLRDTALGNALTKTAYAQGATDIDAAAARASMLYAQKFHWLGTIFDPAQAIAPTVQDHESAHTLAYAVRLQWLAAVLTLVAQGLDVDAHWPSTQDTNHANQPIFAALEEASPSLLYTLLTHSRILVRTNPGRHSRISQLRQFAQQNDRKDAVEMLDLFTLTGATRRNTEYPGVSTRNTREMPGPLKSYGTPYLPWPDRS